MADIVGTEVATGSTSPSPSEFHPVSIPSGGTFTAPLELSAATISGPEACAIYRMRAFDTTLATTVYWNSETPNTASYVGPGPLTNVVISDIS
jgi:hypothetical protein